MSYLKRSKRAKMKEIERLQQLHAQRTPGFKFKERKMPSGIPSYEEKEAEGKAKAEEAFKAAARATLLLVVYFIVQSIISDKPPAASSQPPVNPS